MNPLIVVIIVLIIAIIALLVQLVRSWRFSGGPPISREGRKAVTDSLALLRMLADEGRGPTPAECEQLKAWLQKMKDENIGWMSVTQIENKVEQLCP